jgi:hypothetical protein
MQLSGTTDVRVQTINMASFQSARLLFFITKLCRQSKTLNLRNMEKQNNVFKS